MKRFKSVIYSISYLGLILTFYFISGCRTHKVHNEINLVVSNDWFVTGPTVEMQGHISRNKKGTIKVIANNSPTTEIELNVPISPINPLNSNEGLPISLQDNSTFIEIKYKSSHLIKLQAREGNNNGTGCTHGGSHPMVNIKPSPKSFTTIKIPWKDFKLNGESNGKILDTKKLCKLNFVNYHPTAGAFLEIKSLAIENYK